MLVRPLHVHAVEHLRPVLRLRSAGAGVEGEDGVAAVVFTGEKRRQAGLIDLLFQRGIARFQLGQKARVVHLAAHVDQREQIVARGNELFVAVDFILKLLRAHLILLRALQIVPEAVLVGFQLQPLKLAAGGLDLKGLEQIVKRFIHCKQLLLIGIVFDHSHGVFSFFRSALAEKVYHNRRAKARKNPSSGAKNSRGGRLCTFFAQKTKKPRSWRGYSRDLSAR